MEHGGIDAAPLRRRPRRLSELFAEMARDADEWVSLGDIINALGARAFAPLLVLFAAINLIPILPPGSTAILGLPLLFLSAQMVWGYRRAWLPQAFLNRAVSADSFRTSMGWIVPRLARIERYVRPRYWPFWRRQGDRIVGAVALILSISIVLPIPGGNWMPALATALLGLALLERDGILLIVGSVVAVTSMAVVAAILGGAGYMVHWIFGWMVHG
jgi:hypothetical protein